MIERNFWLEKIHSAWGKRCIVWLSGVRRVGKTTLAGMLDDAVFLNCDLPSDCRRLEDPELFLDGLTSGTKVVFDEIHRIEDPSRVLKIAADAYPELLVLATGSSTLAATRKFRDSLTGRKLSVYLPPVLWTECQGSFGPPDLDRRLLHGGLPESLLADRPDPEFFNEWLAGFYARDIQELFGIRHRTGFLALLDLLLRQAGGLIDYTHLARLSGLSRPTVMAHIEALTIAHALIVLPPFHGGGRREITRRPKAYAFDTGFVAFARGWTSLRAEDRGVLWEHLVLDDLRAYASNDRVHFWRDKSGREINFVIPRGRGVVDTIECKINPDSFHPKSLDVFRGLYPQGRNLVLSPAVKSPYSRRVGVHTVTFLGSISVGGEGA